MYITICRCPMSFRLKIYYQIFVRIFLYNYQSSSVSKNSLFFPLVFLMNYFNILHCVCVFCLFSFVFVFVVVVGHIQFIAQDHPLRMNSFLGFPLQFGQCPQTVKSVLYILKALFNYRQRL